MSACGHSGCALACARIFDKPEKTCAHECLRLKRVATPLVGMWPAPMTNGRGGGSFAVPSDASVREEDHS